jgi:putrescine transport system ATP-binding protein
VTATIQIEGVRKVFGTYPALEEISLEIAAGEFFALLGGSGCGKTTLLRILAGFEEPSAGRVLIDGQDMAGVPPYARPVNIMFQSYALFPHMTVEQNVGYGLRFDAMTRTARRDRVAQMLDLVKLGDFAARRPDQLSGGQRQRVALARSLAKAPKLLLLDEPLGALDKQLREATQFELTRIQAQTGVTFVFVTHDQEEAMSLASRIAVMQSGRIRQVGTPREIYEYPSSRFVAEFIGSINLLEGQVIGAQGATLEIGSAVVGKPIFSTAERSLSPGAPVLAAIRPEKVGVTAARPAGPNALPGVVEDVTYLGKDTLYRVRLPAGGLILANVPNAARTADASHAGAHVWLDFDPASVILMDRNAS